VGAGLVLADGPVVIGVNYESASYGLTLCAERAALARAQAEGSIEKTCALVLSARWKDPLRDPITLTPCGACRQWIAELAARLGKTFPVYSFWNTHPKGYIDYPETLLPDSFK
jgi:cytidine deaminase